MSSPGVEQWIQKGDLRRAAASLVVSYGSDVLATCVAMLRDRTAAEDVMQEVFGEALRGLSSFRGDASPRTWLISIARNRCIDHLRARKRDPWAGTLDDAAADPDAHADESAFGSDWLADRSVVLRALDALAEGDRALIVLRFKNGLEYDELAAAFGLREGTVRMRVSRALSRMRQAVESEGLPPPAIGAPAPAPSQAAAFRGLALGAAPPEEATRARAAAPLAQPGGAPAASSAQSLSWWARLRAWAGLGQVADPVAKPASSPPVGALGLVLAACEPAAPSEALAARLGALVDALGK